MRWWALALACSIVAACAPARQPASAAPASLGRLEEAGDWINGRVSARDLAGNVVLVDVFTVDCFNCRNVVPTLRTLYARDRSRGLRIVGIHAPETPPERSRPYVEQSMATQGIVWPVAVDNDFALWHAYDVQAWPTELFFDRHGKLRRVIVGDSQDDDVRATVESLLGS